MTAPKSPPRAPLAFRVGVVGHRPNRLQQADRDVLAQVLRSILDWVRKEVENVRNVEFEGVHFYDQAPAVLRAISPLAEGTDTLFAVQALAAGYELCCIMPYARAGYERDFNEPMSLEKGSLQRFRDLLKQAEACFELDGDRSDEGAAYGAAGRVVLNQSDLLVVVWDGERQGKRGGTEETMDEARRQGIPIVWVDAHAPHRWQLVVGGAGAINALAGARAMPTSRETLGRDELQKWVRQALDLPRPNTDPLRRKEDDSRYALHQFYSERQPRWSLAIAWVLFRDLVGQFRILRRSLRVEPFEEAMKSDWAVSEPAPVNALVERLWPFYAWPDKLAVLYSDRYRSVFVVAYLLAALAVGMALLPVAAAYGPHGLGETLSISVELLAILTILVLVTFGVRRRWHERWIDYRLAAELVRHLRLVAPLGGGRPFPQIPAHWAVYGQPNATWMSWYVRCVERAAGFPNACVDRLYLLAIIDELRRILAGQVDFHQVNAQRSRRINHRLHVLGLGLLGLTLLACAAHLLPEFGLPEGGALHAWIPESRVLIFFGGFFPALGASLAGIINQGEFRRITKRSASMAEHLRRMLGEVDDLRERLGNVTGSVGPFMGEAAVLANGAARLLINEVLDWRVVLLDRPLQPPA